MCRLLAVLLLLPSLALAQDKAGTKYAFIVAVSKYGKVSGLKPLPFTVKDVEGYRDALLATGYEAKNIRLLHDKLTEEQNPEFRFVPKKAEIVGELGLLLKFLGPEDSVVVVLNGHGVHFKGDATSHFCPLDADLGRKASLLAMDGPGGLYPLLETCKAKSKLLIAGMCRNDPADFPATDQADVKITLGAPEKPPEGIAAFYSCEAGQKTYFDPEKGSYFFNHLSAAWRGEYAGDDELTLDTVFSSVRSRTKKEVFDMSAGLKDQFPEVRRKYDGTWTIPKVVRRDPNGGSEKVFEVTKGVRMTFCWVPSGKATLGSPAGEKERSDDQKEHEFATKGFWLGKYEVQQSEWEGVMGDSPSTFKGATLPVETVSWEDCQKFIGKCEVKGYKVKLPHEDEWEYACRGGKGNGQAFYWGDVLNGDKANHNGKYPYGTPTKGDYKEKTTPVGTYKDKAPHPWGLCDMSGNVFEWCENLYTTTGSGRVVRGGSWDDLAGYCRSAYRLRYAPTVRNYYIGFRLALVP